MMRKKSTYVLLALCLLSSCQKEEMDVEQKGLMLKTAGIRTNVGGDSSLPDVLYVSAASCTDGSALWSNCPFRREGNVYKGDNFCSKNETVRLFVSTSGNMNEPSDGTCTLPVSTSDDIMVCSVDSFGDGSATGMELRHILSLINSYSVQGGSTGASFTALRLLSPGIKGTYDFGTDSFKDIQYGSSICWEPYWIPTAFVIPGEYKLCVEYKTGNNNTGFTSHLLYGKVRLEAGKCYRLNVNLSTGAITANGMLFTGLWFDTESVLQEEF